MKDHIEGAELSAFLDGEMPIKDRARVDGHLAACSACRTELDSLRHLKLVLSSAPRRTMPADLALSLERRFVGAQTPWAALIKPAFWIPAGAVAAAALTVGLWLRVAPSADELPLEPLLAAHSRYSAEGIVAEDNLVASNYSDQLASMETDAPESGLQ
jgi:anti-sigma factor RsiW